MKQTNKQTNNFRVQITLQAILIANVIVMKSCFQISLGISPKIETNVSKYLLLMRLLLGRAAAMGGGTILKRRGGQT